METLNVPGDVGTLQFGQKAQHQQQQVFEYCYWPVHCSVDEQLMPDALPCSSKSSYSMCTEKDRAVPPAVGCPSTTHVRMSPTSTTISIVAANSGVQDMRLMTFSGFGLSRRTLLDCPSQSGVASGAPSAPVRDTKWKSSVVNLVVDRSCPGPAEME
ncbi:hypothetical protein MAR_024905 [Mya arenaria]|uniref:Uncharacterized protein n=1 Tax=Mya arenaria TaxID=6604 RepID=A0ABY7DV31_MYAAR|nr:hypothetical protein MAR_024905 [Mya arenaria]